MLCIISFCLPNKEILFSSRISPAVDYCPRKLNSITYNTWASSVSLDNTRQPDEKLYYSNTYIFPNIQMCDITKTKFTPGVAYFFTFHWNICIHETLQFDEGGLAIIWRIQVLKAPMRGNLVVRTIRALGLSMV